jgi:carbamoyl-phosphate synthase large subunit
MMEKRKITVAVTGINNIDSPGPGIPVIRALKDSQHFDVRIVGLSYETLEPGLFMHDLVDKSYSVPFPSSGVASLMERLRYINERESIDVLIPNFDAELYNFIKIENRLKQEFGIATFLPTIEQFESRHKAVLYEFGERNSVSVPPSKVVFNHSQIAELEGEFKYPIVVKGKYYEAFVAKSREQAISHFDKISHKWGLPIIIQQHISGDEVNVTAIGDGKGSCIGAIPMRKMYITDKGKAWAGITLEDEALLGITQRLMANTKWRGGCELEFIKTREGRYYLLEMNPRFPAWVYLAVGCGQNHPEALVRMALGEDVAPYTTYDSRKMFVRYSYDQIVNLSEFEKVSTMGEL